MVVPFCGSCLGSYKVTPTRNYFGAYGYIGFSVRGMGSYWPGFEKVQGLGFRVWGMGSYWAGF